MLNPARHHDAFSRLERDNTVAKFDAEAAAPDQEELVLALV